jgi:hypothetical protein
MLIQLLGTMEVLPFNTNLLLYYCLFYIYIYSIRQYTYILSFLSKYRTLFLSFTPLTTTPLSLPPSPPHT